MARVAADVARRYDVDGIHLDYIRFPNDEFAYSARALDEFRSNITSRASAFERREYAARAPAGKPRAIRLRFLASPVAIPEVTGVVDCANAAPSWVAACAETRSVGSSRSGSWP